MNTCEINNYLNRYFWMAKFINKSTLYGLYDRFIINKNIKGEHV